MQALFFHEPGSPIRQISTTTHCDSDCWGHGPVHLGSPEITVEFTIEPGYSVKDALRSLYETYNGYDDLDGIKPVRVIRNGIATIVLWSDGQKTVTKIHEGDSYDYYLALLNCYWRKMEQNKGKSDVHYEDNKYISSFASGFWTPADMRSAAKCLEFLAEVKELDTKKEEK